MEKLGNLACKRFDKSLVDPSVRGVLEMGVPITILGGRKPEQRDPVGPEFMAPPTGLEA